MATFFHQYKSIKIFWAFAMCQGLKWLQGWKRHQNFQGSGFTDVHQDFCDHKWLNVCLRKEEFHYMRLCSEDQWRLHTRARRRQWVTCGRLDLRSRIQCGEMHSGLREVEGVAVRTEVQGSTDHVGCPKFRLSLLKVPTAAWRFMECFTEGGKYEVNSWDIQARDIWESSTWRRQCRQR